VTTPQRLASLESKLGALSEQDEGKGISGLLLVRESAE